MAKLTEATDTHFESISARASASTSACEFGLTPSQQVKLAADRIRMLDDPPLLRSCDLCCRGTAVIDIASAASEGARVLPSPLTGGTA